MASIEIQAERVIKGCEKCKKHWDEKERVYVHSVDTPYIEALEAIEKIKKIAEYSLVERELILNEIYERNHGTKRDNDDNWFQMYVTITHNDFELIGEFL